MHEENRRCTTSVVSSSLRSVIFSQLVNLFIRSLVPVQLVYVSVFVLFYYFGANGSQKDIPDQMILEEAP